MKTPVFGIPPTIWNRLDTEIKNKPGSLEIRFPSNGFPVLLIHRLGKPSKKYFLNVCECGKIEIAVRGMNVIENVEELIVPEEDVDK
jgi:hypothetical protein